MRLDKFLSEKFSSRTKAAEAIEKGLITVNGSRVSPSYNVKETDKVEITEAEENYVSAGGYKLAKALKDFSFSVKGGIFADIGASTGGFTDCLFQNGAKKVYCIDVGESQLSEKLNYNNVVVIDNFNARNLDKSLFYEDLDGVVIDVSFISLTYILGSVSDILSRGKSAIALIEPQFECESRNVGKNGIVRDEKTRKKIIRKIYDFAISVDMFPQNLTTAPLVKGKNTEYLILLEKNGRCEKIENLLKCIKI